MKPSRRWSMIPDIMRNRSKTFVSSFFLSLHAACFPVLGFAVTLTAPPVSAPKALPRVNAAPVLLSPGSGASGMMQALPPQLTPSLALAPTPIPRVSARSASAQVAVGIPAAVPAEAQAPAEGPTAPSRQDSSFSAGSSQESAAKPSTDRRSPTVIRRLKDAITTRLSLEKIFDARQTRMNAESAQDSAAMRSLESAPGVSSSKAPAPLGKPDAAATGVSNDPAAGGAPARTEDGPRRMTASFSYSYFFRPLELMHRRELDALLKGAEGVTYTISEERHLFGSSRVVIRYEGPDTWQGYWRARHAFVVMEDHHYKFAKGRHSLGEEVSSTHPAPFGQIHEDGYVFRRNFLDRPRFLGYLKDIIRVHGADEGMSYTLTEKWGPLHLYSDITFTFKGPDYDSYASKQGYWPVWRTIQLWGQNGGLFEGEIF